MNRIYPRFSLFCAVFICGSAAPSPTTVTALAAAPATVADPQLAAADVEKAIARAVQFLKSTRNADGTWPDKPIYAGGLTPLCMLALLHAGVPADDPAMAQSLAHLRRFDATSTYAASLQTMVFCYADPKRDQQLITRNIRWLETKQHKAGDKEGMWAIPDDGTPDHTDNSMTHFALLALYEAERVGVAVSDETWRMALGYWNRSQNTDDGSWGWGPGHPGTGSMTSAGIVSIMIASGKLAAPTPLDGEVVDCCRSDQPNKAIDRALGWLEKHFTARANPGTPFWYTYYLYSLERFGRLTAQRLIAGHDWYREGTAHLLSRQQDDGSWSPEIDVPRLGIVQEFERDTNVSTAFALMFLAKARRPIVLAHLRRAKTTPEETSREALANLVGHVERSWGQELAHQEIDLAAATVDDLLETPVVVIGGRDAPRYSAEEKKKLRAYVDRGGFIFATPSCAGGTFDTGIRRLFAELFPEPGTELKLLPLDHTAWTIEASVDPGMAELWGIDTGCRTGVIYCPFELSCYWSLARIGREKVYTPEIQRQITASRIIGLNVLAYATNRNVAVKDPTRRRSAENLANKGRGTLYVAALAHGAGCNIAPQAAANLLTAAESAFTNKPAAEAREVRIEDESLFDYHMLMLHGRTAVTFTDAERRRLRTYLERGGMIFADAICSSRAFNESLKRELEQIVPGQSLKRIPTDDPLYSTRFGGFDLRKVGYRKSDRTSAKGPLRSVTDDGEPHLEAIRFGERYAVIMSPYDISCSLGGVDPPACEGYSRESALHIAVNVLMYSLRN